MSSSFSFEPRSLIGAPKPITWIEGRLVSKGRYDEENAVERHSSSLTNYIGKRKGVFMSTCIRSLPLFLLKAEQFQKHQNSHLIY